MSGEERTEGGKRGKPTAMASLGMAAVTSGLVFALMLVSLGALRCVQDQLPSIGQVLRSAAISVLAAYVLRGVTPACWWFLKKVWRMVRGGLQDNWP